MNDIKVLHNPENEMLEALSVKSWSVWDKEVSKFLWTYDMEETCYFIQGEVIVTPEGGEPVAMGKGDMVTFPAGLSCEWDIKQAVKKHYTFA